MFCRRILTAFGLSIVATTASAASIQFDLGNGSVDINTGVAANVVVAENAPLSVVTATIDGVTMTLTPVVATGADFASSQWGANTQGLGIRSRDDSGSTSVDQGSNGGQRRRASGVVGEAFHISFDEDVTIDTIRLGALAPSDDSGSGDIEIVELAFVSGVDPFSGSGPLTISSDQTLSTPPIEDLLIGVTINAGTVLSLSTDPLATTASGVLFNDIVVSRVIPEPMSAALVALTGLVPMGPTRRLRG